MSVESITAATSLLPAENRGRVTVARRVVEKIAGQASTEVAAVPDERRPRIAVTLDGRYATLQVEVGLGYPTPLRAAVEDLRAHLIRRVERLTGVTVRRLDITVGWLDPLTDLPKRLA